MYYPKRDFWVYIMTNRSKTLYTGGTSNLGRRVRQHQNHVFPGFTDAYQINRLVYFEHFCDIRNAINREKRIKGLTRLKKMALIVGMNPTWRDLSEDWGKPIELKHPEPNA